MSRPFRSSENFSTVLTDGRKTRLTPAGRSPPAANRKGRTGRRCPGSSAPSSMICREAKPAAILGNRVQNHQPQTLPERHPILLPKGHQRNTTYPVPPERAEIENRRSQTGIEKQSRKRRPHETGDRPAQINQSRANRHYRGTGITTIFYTA